MSGCGSSRLNIESGLKVRVGQGEVAILDEDL